MESAQPQRTTGTDAGPAAAAAAALDVVTQALARLRFGTVLLTVHEGKIVQVDVTERRRFS